jgi:hypothetical protein
VLLTAEGGNVEMAKIIVAQQEKTGEWRNGLLFPATVDIRDYWFMCALNVAARERQQVDMARFLISQGADVEALDHKMYVI